MNINLSNFDGTIIEINSIYDLKPALINETEKGDTILFSCGGSSFNDFNDYEDRGNYFKKIVKELKNET